VLGVDSLAVTSCRLALGTAQFGLDYGITNKRGKLHYAEESGVTTIDTAAAYGNSEETLGSLQAGDRFRIVTKISVAKASEVEGRVLDSVKALEVETVDTVLFHDHRVLLDVEDAWSQLQRAKNHGLIRKAGVSVYHRRRMSDSARTFTGYCPASIQRL